MSFSNYGARIDVAAPGTNVLSTAPNNGYLLDSGTSMSAPHISAACAMILIDNPSLSPGGVWQKLKSACQLKLVFVPSEATATVTWKSNKPKIASVDANGLVTAKKIGTAKITAQTSNGQKASIKIKVVKNSARAIPHK